MTDRPSGAPPRPAGGHLSLGPDALGPPGAPYPSDRRDTRLGGALGVSILCHLAVVLLAIIGFSRPAPTVEIALVDPLPLEIVWVPDPGPGGGGGGGGNEMPEPPAEVELPGEDPITVPVEAPPEPVPEPEPVPDPEPPPIQVSIPAVTMAGAAVTAPGVVESGGASQSLGRGRDGGGGDGERGGVGPGAGRGLGPGDDGGVGGGPRGPGGGVTSPVALLEVKPSYTPEAMRAKVQGEVWVQCVVRTNGTCTDLRVVRSLDTRYGLDDEALEAASQWRFAPGRMGGQPVPVQVVIQLDFALR